jgi:PAS domain-containing protein
VTSCILFAKSRPDVGGGKGGKKSLDVSINHTPFIDLPLGSRSVDWLPREDGAILMRSREALGPFARVLTERLAETARQHPDRILLAERGSDGEWHSLTYGVAMNQVRAIGQALLDRGAELPPAIAARCEMFDITDEVAATEALRASEQLLRRLADTLPVGVVQIDRARRVGVVPGGTP